MVGVQNIKTILNFYKYFIRDQIEYASIVYDSTSETNKKKLDRIQHRALEIIAGTGTKTPIGSQYRNTTSQVKKERTKTKLSDKSGT